MCLYLVFLPKVWECSNACVNFGSLSSTSCDLACVSVTMKKRRAIMRKHKGKEIHCLLPTLLCMQFSNCTSTCPESGVCSTYYPPTMPCRKRTCVSACNLCPGLCYACTCIEICGCMLEFLKSIDVRLSLQKCIYICELTAVSRVLFCYVHCLCQGCCVEHIHCACTCCLCVSIKDLSLCSDGCSNARVFNSSSESLLPPYMHV